MSDKNKKTPPVKPPMPREPEKGIKQGANPPSSPVGPKKGK